MKTKFTVFTSLVILLASVFAEPATAQRRTSTTTVIEKWNKEKSKSNDGKKERVIKKEVKKKETKSDHMSGRRTPAAQKQPATRAKSDNLPSGKRTKSAGNQKVNEARKVPAQSKSSVKQRKPVNAGTPATRTNPVRTQRENYRSNNSARYENQAINKPANPRARTEHNRTVYRVNPNENRYKPVKNYKGSKNNWSAKQAYNHVHHTKRDVDFYRHYDHRNYKHWDRAWENYRWNVNSWRDYYHGYHPQSYRFHKHYYYHPAFGHVIKKFSYKPVYFVHNNVRYYNYNGHFFRRFKGVGYVLADIPYGIVFKKLPAGHERVYVNGYLYFRVGNLFFESNPFGYALIHYPERYFALEPDYYNGGYFRSVDFSLSF